VSFDPGEPREPAASFNTVLPQQPHFSTIFSHWTRITIAARGPVNPRSAYCSKESPRRFPAGGSVGCCQANEIRSCAERGPSR
jgi:hypothetical protein